MYVRKRIAGKTEDGNGKDLKRVSHQVIAREAGVSRATVSLILAGRDQTSQQTRQLVLEVANRLKYRPNLLVHGMQSGRTYTVGVIMPASMFFHGQIARGIHDALVAANYVPIQLWIEPRKNDKSIELTQIHRLIDRRVDGMIIFPVDESVPELHFREIWQRDVPLVTVDRETTAHADHVGTDEELGARLAAEHLLELGHRRVAHVTFPRTIGSNMHRRATAFARRMEERRGTCEIIDGPFEELTSSIARVLEQKLPPTAVFAATDSMAIKVYSAAAMVGLNIPDTLSVIGYADFPFASDMVPPLTTVRQDPYEMGRMAAEMLLHRLLGGTESHKPRRLRMAPELIVRASTSAPAVAAT